MAEHLTVDQVVEGSKPFTHPNIKTLLATILPGVFLLFGFYRSSQSSRPSAANLCTNWSNLIS